MSRGTDINEIKKRVREERPQVEGHDPQCFCRKCFVGLSEDARALIVALDEAQAELRAHPTDSTEARDAD